MNHPPEFDAIVAVLNDHPHEPIPAYVWHTGGGIFAVRVDISPEGGEPVREDPPHMLITPREDYDGVEGYAIGVYRTWTDDGGWPIDNKLRCVDTLAEIHAVIMEGAEFLCGGDA